MPFGLFTSGGGGSSGKDDFLHGQQASFASSNVASGLYDQAQSYLQLGYKNGAMYGYHDVSPQEAASLYGAGSKGKWVWDHLRRRGTVYGYQKPYAYISGLSHGGAEPSYYADDKDREWHRRIAPSGRDLEWSSDTDRKVPMAYQAKKSSSWWSLLGRLFGGQHKAAGGEVYGDAAMGDNVPVRATAGEFVVNKEASQKYRPLLQAINGGAGGGQDGHYAAGGVVGGVARAFLGSQGGLTGAIAAGAGTAGGPLGVATMLTVTAMGMLKDKLMDLTRMASDPKSVLGAMVAPYQSQVAAYNPASVERFNLALDNLSAAAGYILEPIVTGARDLADELNVLITSVGPDLRGAIQPVIPLFRDFVIEGSTGFLGLLRDGAVVLRGWLPELKDLGAVVGRGLRVVFDAAMPLGRALYELVEFVNLPFRALSGFGSTLETTTTLLRVFAATLAAVSQGASNGLDNWDWTNVVAGALQFSPVGPLAAAYNWNTVLRSGQSPADAFRAVWNATSPAATNGAMTMATQPARQISIEQAGMDARQQAFSLGADAAAQTATNTLNIFQTVREILTWIRTQGGMPEAPAEQM